MEIERLNIATDQIIDKPLDNCILLLAIARSEEITASRLCGIED